MFAQPVGAALEEIIVLAGGTTQIPGGVQFVIGVLAPGYIPGVTHRVAGDHARVQTGLERQAVESDGNALAHRSIVDKRGIARVFQFILVIVQVCVVVFDVAAEVIVDCPEPRILRFSFQRERVKNGIDPAVHLSLLRGGRIVQEGEDETAIIGVFIGIHIFDATTTAAPLEFQIIAFPRGAGMGESAPKYRIENFIDVRAGGHGVVYRNLLTSCDKLRTHGGACLRQGFAERGPGPGILRFSFGSSVFAK